METGCAGSGEMKHKSFKLMHNHAMTLGDEPSSVLPSKTRNVALGINLLQNIGMELVMNCNQGAVIGFFSWLIKVNK